MVLSKSVGLLSPVKFLAFYFLAEIGDKFCDFHVDCRTGVLHLLGIVRGSEEVKLKQIRHIPHVNKILVGYKHNIDNINWILMWALFCIAYY